MRAATLSLLVFLVLAGLSAAFGQDAPESAGFSLPPAPQPTEAAPPDKPLADLVKANERFRTTVDKLVARYQSWIKDNQFYALPEALRRKPRPPVDSYPWFRHLQESREAVKPVTEAYERAIKLGWDPGDPNITEAARIIEEGKRRLAATGIWFARRIDQPAIAEDEALEQLVDEACRGLFAARSAVYRGYVEERWAQVDRTNRKLLEANRSNTEVLYNLGQHQHYRAAVRVLDQIRQQTLPLLDNLPATPDHVHGPNCGHAHYREYSAGAAAADQPADPGTAPGSPDHQGEPAGR